MGRRRLTVAACALAAAAAAFSAPAHGQNDAPPESLKQPLADGCQRSAAGLLTNTSAHWVYVYGDPSARVAQGVAIDPHPGGGDLPQAHDWYDQNFDLRTDPQSSYLGGLPAGPTVHVERESGKIPTFAWADDQDAVKLWGSWIWDCGHWGPQDPTNRDFLLPGQGVPEDEGTDLGSGESTEIHPYGAIVLTRDNPYFPPVEETQADVFISSDGTRAHDEEQCAYDHKPPAPSLPTYGPDFTACTANPTPSDTSDPASYPAPYHQPVNDRDYTFFVPAPPKPQPDAQLRYQVLAGPGNGLAPEEIVQPRADGIDVTVPFRGFGSAQQRQAYAKSFLVGWTGSVQHIPARVEVTLKTLKVINALDTPIFGGTSSQVPPGEYGMYLSANGLWSYLNDFVPGLGAVMDNTSFQIDRTIGLNVPAGRRVRLKMATRECDLPHINPCPQTPEVADDNDNPGDATDEYPSVDASLGDHTMAGGPAGNPNWTLTYNVKLISRATTADASTAPPPGGLIGPAPASSYPYAGPPGGVSPASSAGCADTFPPRARFSRPARVTRRRLALRGHASDLTCGHKRGRVTHVAVAVARRVGAGRCRFLMPTGRFAPASSCARRGYLAVRGTRAWSLRRRQQMPRGTYTAWTRSVDRAGNVGYTHPAADRLVFRVR